MAPANSSGLKIGVVMDPIATIKPAKDTTLAMMRAAQNRGATLFYMGVDDVFVEGGIAYGAAQALTMTEDKVNWCTTGATETVPLRDFSMVWMRKDPPVDKRFLHACHMLEQAVRNGARVINNPSSLVSLNEKLFAAHFPELCPPTVVTSSLAVLRDFLKKHKKIIIKPLDAMGGAGVYMIDENDVNFEVVWETQTAMGTYPAMAQAFLPAIAEGDIRVIMINGKPFPQVLARIPKAGSIRGNIAVGGSGVVRPINAVEQNICDIIGPTLVERGITLAGIDIIGDRLIEINITSPTGLVLITQACGTDVAAVVVEALLASQ